MNPQDKAKELISKFNPFVKDKDRMWGVTAISASVRMENAKQCALIAVEEMIDCFDHMGMTNHDSMPYRDHWLKYWNEVKTEIEKL